VDGDSDGFTEDVDCDDSDLSVYPGAAEVCDGVDNNCNGAVDEGLLDTWYLDADGDGFGDAERDFKPRLRVERLHQQRQLRLPRVRLRGVAVLGAVKAPRPIRGW
jgi:hypothetical protein